MAISVGVILAVILAGFVAAKIFGGDDVSVSDPIPIGEGPLRIATGEGSVWVTSAARRHPVRDRIRCPGMSVEAIHLERGVAGVAVGEGSVWVASPRTGEVLRIDPATPAGSRTGSGSAAGPAAIVFGGDRVWVADEDGPGVTAINAQGGRVFKRGIVPHTRAAAPRGRRRRGSG